MLKVFCGDVEGHLEGNNAAFVEMLICSESPLIITICAQQQPVHGVFGLGLASQVLYRLSCPLWGSHVR